MIKKIFIASGTILLIGLAVLSLKELLPKKPIPDIIELPPKYKQQEPEKTTEINKQTSNNVIDAKSVQNQLNNNESVGFTANLLIDSPIGFADIDYPNIYGYDYKNKTIKTINIENKTFTDLYSNSKINFISFSPSKKYISFRETLSGLSRFYFLDLQKDKIYPLDVFIKNILWSKKDELFYYASNNSSLNYIGRIKVESNGLKNEKISEIGFVNPIFNVYGDNLLIANKTQSPLFLINFRYGARKIIFDEQQRVSFLAGNNLIFINYADNEKSAIADFNGKILKEFKWRTLNEKCSFTKRLICGVPLFSANNSYDNFYTDWLELRETTFDKLIVVDEKTFEEKEIILENNFDIIHPHLTPIGIIFTNRIDGKLYLAPME